MVDMVLGGGGGDVDSIYFSIFFLWVFYDDKSKLVCSPVYICTHNIICFIYHIRCIYKYKNRMILKKK